MTAPRLVRSRKLLVVLLAAASLFTAACQPEQSPAPRRVAPGAPIPPSTTDGVVLVNNDRAARGIPRLSRAQDLDDKAQAHADWMARNATLAHSNLTAAVAEPYNRLAENVGVGTSMWQVHSAFMGSTTHRNNMLDGRLRSIGVGAARSADGRVWVVQVFKG